MRRFFSSWTILSSITVIAIILWSFFSYRWILTYHFDYTYFKDWYDHSQWQIPLSPRIMGDAELYQLSGYSLVTGGSPFQINPEVPPLVKYTYGLSILATDNPYYASAFFYFASIIGFGWLSWLAFPKNKSARLLSLLLFLLNPLFSSQIGQVGLDLPQMCFLFFHCIFLFLATRTATHTTNQKIKHTSFYFMSGVFLGAFTATKIGFFLPMIVLVDGWLLWQSKQLKWLFFLGLVSVVTYIAAYFPYFLHGHSLIEWLKAQKWMFDFYLSSHFSYLPGMIFPSLVVGYFIHWTEGLTAIKEWTVVWPVSLILFFWTATQHFLSRKKTVVIKSDPKQTQFWNYLLCLVAGLVIMNIAIPFWPRYLLLILPFLLLIASKFLIRHRKMMFLVLALLLVQSLWYSFAQPQEMITLSTAAWQTESYAEVYNFTTHATQQKITRQNFVRTLQVVQNNLRDPDISITTHPVHSWPWQNEVVVPIDVTYHTVLGNVDVPSELHLIREYNQWKIDWQWHSVLPNFDSYSQVILTQNIPAGGKLITSDAVTLSHQGSWPFISVIPNKVQDSEAPNDELTALTFAQGPAIRVNLFVTHPGDLKVPIGFVIPLYESDTLQRLSRDPSIFIDQRLTRVYDSTVSQSPNLNNVQNWEQYHLELFGQMGGQILIKKPSGEKITFFEKEMKDGQNVILPQTFQELFDHQYAKTK